MLTAPPWAYCPATEMNTLTVIRSTLDEILKPNGFTRAKGVWTRPARQGTAVVDLQMSKARDRVTLSLGLLDPENHRLAWGQKPPRTLVAAICTVQAGLEQLAKGRDHWWPLDSIEAAPNLLAAYQMFGEPFLESVDSVSGMDQFLESTQPLRPRYPDPLSVVNWAILRSRLGDSGGARAILFELHQKTLGDWKQRAVEVSDRLGCGTLDTETGEPR